MSKENPDCKDVMRHICESLGEDLESEKCVAIKHHLDNCDSCKNYFKTVELTIDYYKKYNVEVSKDAHTRLMDFLNLSDCEE
jgi:predicted anti-sigma-YlaC factor YlaD